LFPGYIFLRGSRDDVYTADRTRRVSNIIKVHNQERLENELLSLSMVLGAGVTLDPYPYLRAGVRVEVRSGPFRGLQGIIEGRGKSNHLILQVDLLGQAVSMEIDPSLLDVVG